MIRSCMASSDPARFGDDFKLTLLTDDPGLAADADAAGIDRIGVDIERLGKAERQRCHAGARLSGHSLEDLEQLSRRVRRGRLF